MVPRTVQLGVDVGVGVGVGVEVVEVVELTDVAFDEVELVLSVEDGDVVVLKDVELDDKDVDEIVEAFVVEKGKLEDVEEIVPVPVPVDEVKVAVVTVVEEPCDRVMVNDELQDAVEVIVEVMVEVRTKVSVLVGVRKMLECINHDNCLPPTVLSSVRVPEVNPLQEHVLAYTESRLEQLSPTYVGTGPMMVVVLEEEIGFWRALTLPPAMPIEVGVGVGKVNSGKDKALVDRPEAMLLMRVVEQETTVVVVVRATIVMVALT